MTGHLEVKEINDTEAALVRQIQTESFPDESRKLSAGQSVTRGPLQTLAPFMRKDEQLIRVGGRLENASMPFDEKHPIVLPKGHPITELLFHDMHKLTLHAGPSHLLAAARRKYWPIDGRNRSRAYSHKCIVCFRYRPTTAQQIMADLPSVRVNQQRAFHSVGIDYCGPFKIMNRRNQPAIKCYICVFVCMATKAAHLELVTDLTTNAFIAALKRFWGKRGHPAHIYCDNATNFVGGDRELQRLLRQFETQQHKSNVIKTSSSLGIQFHFIPPRSPSFGGLWEACVKSTKEILYKVTIDVTLTYEEMLTTLAQVEACLNSRPLTPLSSDPRDLAPLTPGHFLIGGPLEAIPEPDLQHLPYNHLSRWQRMQRVVQEFWSRWYKEYLPTLQKRYKWPGPKPNLSVGDMVLLQEDNQPPLKWPIARVTKVYPASDGKVRIVDVLTDDKSTYSRGIHKLCPLPHQSSGSSSNSTAPQATAGVDTVVPPQPSASTPNVASGVDTVAASQPSTARQ